MNLTSSINTASQVGRGSSEQGAKAQTSGASAGEGKSVVRVSPEEKSVSIETSKPKNVIQPVEETVKVSLSQQERVLSDEASTVTYKKPKPTPEPVAVPVQPKVEVQESSRDNTQVKNQKIDVVPVDTANATTNSNTRADTNVDRNSTSEARPVVESSRTLDKADLRDIEQLQQRDREGQQQGSADGATTGAPQYEFKAGLDGNHYATVGEVSVKFSGSSDPTGQTAEAKQIKNAGNASAQPSAQDRAVAARAEQPTVSADKGLLKETVVSGEGANTQARVPDREQNIRANSTSVSFSRTSSQASSAQSAEGSGVQASESKFSFEQAASVATSPTTTTVENAQALFDEQRWVAASLQESRDALARDFGGGAGSNSISANFSSQKPVTESVDIPIAQPSVESQPIDMKIDKSEPLSADRVAVKAEGFGSLSDSKAEKSEERAEKDQNIEEEFDKAQGKSVDSSTSESTIRRANNVTSEEARLSQNIDLGQGQTDVYERNLRAIDADQQRTQEPGGVFTAIV